jgi:hypothetical protein
MEPGLEYGDGRQRVPMPCRDGSVLARSQTAWLAWRNAAASASAPGVPVNAALSVSSASRLAVSPPGGLPQARQRRRGPYLVITPMLPLP